MLLVLQYLMYLLRPFPQSSNARPNWVYIAPFLSRLLLYLACHRTFQYAGQLASPGLIWEAGLVRLTASAGLPLQWVKNPEWLKLCDRFISRAKIPSAKVLTKHVTPDVLRGLKLTAKEECRGDSHHLLGFMMTVR
jgi:hypothetical protein